VIIIRESTAAGLAVGSARRGGSAALPSPAGVIPLYGRNAGMDRQQIFALFFAFLMVSSMVAYGVSLL
jgi:hypothetical protein